MNNNPMKRITRIFLGCLLFAGLAGCSDQEIGYLQTVNAVYVPDRMDIRLVLDEELDAYRIYNVAPWVSPKMQGVIGTNPIRYEIAGIESADGDAEMFRSLLTVRGGGRMEFPLVSDITPGEYRISIRVSNEGHSRVLENIFTFNVKEK